MRERLTPYVRAALLVEIAKEQITYQDQYLTLDIISNNLRLLLGVAVPEDAFYEAFDLLMEEGCIDVIDDPVTDPFYRLNRIRSKEVYGQDTSNASSPTFKYASIGQQFLQRAIEALEGDAPIQEEPSGFDQDLSPVPASDRIVTLTDNQQVELEAVSTQLIDAVEKENAIDGDSTLRQRILGQLKAGRELIRAQTLRAYLLYETLVSALGQLVDRYKGHAIGIAAAKLLELLIEHIFGLR